MVNGANFSKLWRVRLNLLLTCESASGGGSIISEEKMMFLFKCLSDLIMQVISFFVAFDVLMTRDPVEMNMMVLTECVQKMTKFADCG